MVRIRVVLIIAPPQIMSEDPLLKKGWMRAMKGIGSVASIPPVKRSEIVSQRNNNSIIFVMKCKAHVK